MKASPDPISQPRSIDYLFWYLFGVIPKLLTTGIVSFCSVFRNSRKRDNARGSSLQNYLDYDKGNKRALTFLSLSLHHVDFRAVLSEFHFVHELVDEKNSAPMIGINIFADRATGNDLGRKTGARIAHHDQQASIPIAGHITFDDF